MPPDPDLSFLLGEVRELVARFKAGGPEAPVAFQEFTSIIFRRTIVDVDSPIVPQYGPRGRDTFIIGGRSNRPLRLRNGYYLSLTVTLFYDSATTFWKVRDSRIQYQEDEAGTRWFCRYDYLRDPDNAYPAAHLHVHGTSMHPYQAGRTDLQDLHFPTGRVSLEAIVRLLVESYGVLCPQWETKWRRVLTESERPFLKMAHHPTSGPSS